MLSPRPGFSIFTTSAPRSPSSEVHHGPAAWWLRSMTRMPASAPLPVRRSVMTPAVPSATAGGKQYRPCCGFDSRACAVLGSASIVVMRAESGGAQAAWAAPRALRRVDLGAALIIAAAVVVRVYDLGRRSLWLDEAWAAIGALDGPFDVVHVRVTPLLFAGLVRLSVAAFGRSEVAVRLPAALFGIGATLLAWRLGRQLVGVGGGRMAAAIVGLCPIPVYYGKELKAYSADLFLTLGLALAVERLR